MDLHAVDMLKELAEELKTCGVRIPVVEARAQVRDRLRNAEMTDDLGGVDRQASVAYAVATIQNRPLGGGIA